MLTGFAVIDPPKLRGLGREWDGLPTVGEFLSVYSVVRLDMGGTRMTRASVNSITNDVSIPLGKLPDGFGELERFIAYWDQPNSHLRWARRQAATAEQMRDFYDVMLEHAEAALEHLRKQSLDSLNEPDSRLLRLLLALMHAAIGVEVHDAPVPPHTPYPHQIQIHHFTTHFQ